MQLTSTDSSARAAGGQGREIRSEAHGPHWVAWIADADGKPRNSVVLVGATQEDAEQKARTWAEKWLA